MKWCKTLDSAETPIGKCFDRIIVALILYSILSFALETLPSAAPYQRLFTLSEWIVVTVFTLEYLIRMMARGRAYCLSWAGLIDLIAIAPFYLSLGMTDIVAVRAVRVLRLLRTGKLWRYASAWQRLKGAFLDVRNELIIYFVLTLTLVFFSSVGIYYCEHDAQPAVFQSVFHSMWWAIATLSTVGYGDIYPVTVLGRIFTSIILLLGLSVLSIPSGLIASALVRQARNDQEK